MILSILIIIVIALTAFWWGNQGSFSAMLHMLCALVAGAIGFAAWEPLTHMLLDADGLPRFVAQFPWGLGLAVPFVCRTLDRLRLGRVRVALRVCVVLRVRVVVLVRGRRVSRHVGLFREQLHLELVLRDRVAPRPVPHLVSDTDAHRHTNILGPRERDADGTAARSRCSAPGALSCVRPHFVVCECVCVARARVR